MTESVVNTPHNPVTTYSIDSNGDVVTDASGAPAVNMVAEIEKVIFRDEPAGNVRTMTGTSAQTAAITATLVRVVADAACSISVGTNPTAVFNTSLYLPANVPQVVRITSGDKIAAISGGAGNLYYHPVA